MAVQDRCHDPKLPPTSVDAIFGRYNLERVLNVYVEQYNTARPHRGISLGLPAAEGEPAPASLAQIRRIDRVDVLGGLVHEYRHAA
jgi:putative transposase